MKRAFVTFIGGPLNLIQQAIEYPMSSFTYREIDLSGVVVRHFYEVIKAHSSYYKDLVHVGIYTGSKGQYD